MEISNAGGRRTAVDIELFLVRAVGAQAGCQNTTVGDGTRRLCCLQYQRASAIAEQDASRAVVPIENAREGLRAYHQNTPGQSAANIGISRGNRIDEA